MNPNNWFNICNILLERSEKHCPRPHYWKVRNKGYRELLIKKKWGLRGAYASKFIAGREVMQRIIEKYDDHLVVRFEFKDLFWDEILLDDNLEKSAGEDPS